MKVCKIHGYLSEEMIKTSIYKGKNQRKCRMCENERAKKYHEKNKEIRNKKDRDYWEKKKDQIKERRASEYSKKLREAWLAKNQGRYNEYYCNKQKEYRETLHPTYIKRLLVGTDWGLNYSLLPPILIEMKQLNLMIRNKIREKRLIERIELNDKERE